MSNPTTISGMLDAKGLKIAILATRFNDFIVDAIFPGQENGSPPPSASAC